MAPRGADAIQGLMLSRPTAGPSPGSLHSEEEGTSPAKHPMDLLQLLPGQEPSESRLSGCPSIVTLQDAKATRLSRDPSRPTSHFHSCDTF